MNIIIGILSAFAAVSLPVMYLLEWKYGRGKWAKWIHAILAVSGFIIPLIVSIGYYLKVSPASEGVRMWADDFFYGYLNLAEPVQLVLTALLAVAAAIRHQMRRIRMTLTVLISVTAVLVTFFVASLAADGQFAVDLYIRALAPGLGLLPHAVPLCERRKKSD